MEMSARVVDEPGIKPYWLGLTDGNTVGFKDFSMI
jgi:hypothetical protein